MFKNAPRLIGFVSVMLVITFCIIGALGVDGASIAEGATVLLRAFASFIAVTSCVLLLFARRDSDAQEWLRRLLVFCLCFGSMAFVIWPTNLNPAHSLPYLVAAAGITAFFAGLITPRADVPVTLDVLYRVSIGVPLVAAVLAWKIGLGPLWDAHPILGGLAAFSVTSLALGLVYGLQGRVPEFPVREITV